MRIHLRRCLYLVLVVNGFVLFSLKWRSNHVSIKEKWTPVLVNHQGNRSQQTRLVPTGETRMEQPSPLLNGTKCAGLPVPEVRQDNQSWVKLAGTDGYIFSAYYDDIASPTIRVIGLLSKRTLLENKFICQMWFRPEEVASGLTVVDARPDFIPEDHGKR